MSRETVDGPKVGQLYDADVVQWPESADYNMLDTGHELRIFWKRPKREEIQAVRRAPLHLALVFAAPVIGVAWRFDGIGDWSDCLFNIHLLPPGRRPDFSQAAAGPKTFFQVLLIDAESGLLAARRVLSLPPRTASLLYAEARAQLSRQWSQDAYDAAIHEFYARYPTSNDLAALATHLVRPLR